MEEENEMCMVFSVLSSFVVRLVKNMYELSVTNEVSAGESAGQQGVCRRWIEGQPERFSIAFVAKSTIITMNCGCTLCNRFIRHTQTCTTGATKYSHLI